MTNDLIKSWNVALLTFAYFLFASSTMAAGKGKPVIKDVVPAVSYPEDTTNGFVHLKVLGENFPTSNTDLVVRLGKQGKLKLLFDQEKEEADTVFAEIVDDSEINLSRIPRIDIYPRLTLQVGRKEESGIVAYSEPFPILVSKVSRATPVWVALVVTGIALGIPILILRTRRKQRGEPQGYRVGDKSYNVFLQLFLDPETDTYSLSKLQFYAWTAASVFGYTYLTVARSMVQGIFDFAEIPQHLPGLILISGGTTAAAQAVTTIRGPKGAGSVQPSFADFITTGGVVAVERLQFFVWTCLGVIAFVFLVLMHDPGAISALPVIPKEFLLLMGLSSAGYVGGKAARRPGPIIDEIKATFSSLVLEIHGRNLSKDASFEIEATKVTLDLIAPSSGAVSRISSGIPGDSTAAGIRVIESEPDQQESGFAKVLEFTIKVAKPEWFWKPCQLTIINPDGQRATWPFEYKGMLKLQVTFPQDEGKTAEIKKLLSTQPSQSYSYEERATATNLLEKVLGLGGQVMLVPVPPG